MHSWKRNGKKQDTNDSHSNIFVNHNPKKLFRVCMKYRDDLMRFDIIMSQLSTILNCQKSQ